MISNREILYRSPIYFTPLKDFETIDADKLSIILGLITTMEKETGMVDKERLIERIQTEYDILAGEAERMIGQLLKEGTLFAPRDGFLKKT